MILGYDINGEGAGDMTFKADQSIKIYTAYEPISYYGVSNLTFSRTTYNGTDCFVTEFAGPQGNANINFTFNGSFTTNIEGAQHIYAYTATDVFGETRDLAKNGTETFHKGDTFKIYSKYVPTACEPELAWSSSSYNGTPCYMAQFAPSAEGSLTMSFTGGIFYVTIQDKEEKIPELLAEYFAGYQAIHDDGTHDDLKHESESNTNDDTFSSYGTCVTNFSLGDTYVLYLKAIPESVYLNGVEMTYTEEEVGGETYIVYRFTPTADGRLNITFGSPTTPGPIVETTFKVYIKADRANVINAQVRTSSGNTDILIGEEYTEVECPESGYIYCTILDESMYSYLSFVNTDENVDFLDYNPPTTYPVTIRKSRATSDTDMIDNSGDHFTVTTKSKANLQWYSLTLNILEDNSNVKVEVGTSYQAGSQANRPINDLTVGSNTIHYSEEDTYLVVSSAGLRPLYNVEFDKGTVTKSEDMRPQFYFSLNADTADGVATVHPNEPIQQGDKEFTFNIDHPELIVNIRRFVGGSTTSYEDIDLSTITAESNTLLFSTGDMFRIQLSDDYEPQYVRQNSSDIAPWNGLYDITPAENDVVTIYYGTLPELPTFTVVTDRPDMVTQIYNYTRGREYLITEEYTTIEFFAGNEFQIRLGSLDPKYVTFNDAAVDKNGDFYQFSPTADGELKVIFAKVPTPPVDTFTLIVDNADNLDSVCENNEDEDVITEDFTNGENTIPVGSGSLLLYVSEEATSVTIDEGEPLEFNKKGRNKWYELEVTKGSVVNVKFEKDPTFTLIVDDPAKMIGFAEEANVGSNTYTIAAGTTFSFSTPEGVTPKAATIGSEAIEAVDGVYTFTPADGDVVKVFFNYVPECTGALYPVSATFVNEGTEDVINYIFVENTEVAVGSFIGGNVLVDKESQVSFNYKNNDFIINSITVNGSAKENTGAVSFIVNAPTTVTFDVRRPAVIAYTITCAAPTEIEAYYPDRAQQSGLIPVEFEAQYDDNANLIESDVYNFVTNELHPTIVIKKKAGVEAIITVDNNNTAVEANADDQFIIDLTDGDAIVINSAAVQYDEKFVVILDIDTENCVYDHNEAFKGIEETGTLTGVKSGRTIELVNGRNVVSFNSTYDGSFLLGFSKIPGSLHTYVNNEKIEPDHSRLDMYFLFEAAEGTLVRSTYHASGEVITETIVSEIEDEVTGEITYQEVTVTKEKDVVPEPLDIYLDVTPSIKTDILVLRDLYQVVYDFENAITSSSEPLNTLYSIFISANQNVHLDIKPVKESAHAAEYMSVAAMQKASDYSGTPIDRVDIDPSAVPAGYKHVCSFHVNQPLSLSMEPSDEDKTTGIENVSDGAALSTDIYNLQGVKVKAGASAADLRALPAGLYIFGGQKVLVK